MSHKSEVISVEPVGDGHLAVIVRCCDDESSDSVLTLGELHRDDAELDRDIQAHQAKVEKLHAARDHAKRHIERLMGKVDQSTK